jgi:uncharacterized cupredoxin-like copper-binding protein
MSVDVDQLGEPAGVTAPAAAPPGPQAAGRRRPQGRPPQGGGGRRRLGRGLLPLALVAVLAVSGVAVAALRAGDGVRTVEMTMRYSRFEPAVIEVDQGDAVRFTIANADPIDHEFIVGDEPVHQRHRVGRERHHHGDVPGEVSVPAGERAETTFRFDRPGRVLFACHLPGHEAYGMVGVVEVRA